MPWSSILSWNWTVKTNLAKIQVIHVWRRYQPVQLAPCACYRKCMSLITDQQQKLVCTFMPWFSLSVTINAARRKVCRSWRTVIKKVWRRPRVWNAYRLTFRLLFPQLRKEQAAVVFQTAERQQCEDCCCCCWKDMGENPNHFMQKPVKWRTVWPCSALHLSRRHKLFVPQKVLLE